MRTPEELHAGRLWVTKYGWGGREDERTGVRRRATHGIVGSRESEPDREIDREIGKEKMRW